MKRDEYIVLVKDAAVKIGTKALMNALVSRFAFIGLPFFNPVIGMIVGQLVSILVKETEFRLFLEFVDFRINTQAKEFENAAKEYSRIQKDGTDDQKKNAEQKLISSFRRFAKFTT